MKSIRTLTIALASLIAAPAAFAQDATTDTASSSYGKRFAVVGGAAILKPDRDPAPGLKIDGDVAPVISASWYATDNVAVELWGAADKFNHRVKADGPGKIGTVDQQPIALSGQYHFGTPDKVMRPFVGLGYYESNFSDETIGGDLLGRLAVGRSQGDERARLGRAQRVLLELEALADAVFRDRRIG